MKTVVVTGAGGFLGQSVARYFVMKGWSVIGIGKTLPDAPGHKVFAKFLRRQLPHPDWNECIRETRPTLCIHCAGIASVPESFVRPAKDFTAGPALTFELLDTLRKNSPSTRFVFLSSASVYGCPARLPIAESTAAEPISPYGFHKRQSEALCHEFARCFDLATAALRIFSAYGRGLRRQVVWDVCQKLITGTSLHLQGSGDESRDFVHAHDVARAVDAVQHRGAMQGECYNVATGHETTIRELVRMLSDQLAIKRTPAFTGRLPPGTPHRWRADVGRLQSIGWVPTVALRDGLADFVTWVQEVSPWRHVSA